MGFAQLMRRAAPMIQAATADNGESNLDLLRRLAVSKIKIATPQLDLPALKPSVDQRMTPPFQSSSPDNQNLDPGFSPRPPSISSPALSASPDLSSTPPRLGAPDVSKVDPAQLEQIVAGLNYRNPDAPVSTSVDGPAPEATLNPRSTEPVDSGYERFSGGLIYDRHGRPLKPQYLNPSSDAALMGRQEYLNALQDYKPESHNSRLKSALITAGRGALAGLRYGPGGALGGGLAGLIGGAVDPTQDEKYAKRRDLAEGQTQMASDLQFRKKQSDLATEAVDRQYKLAQAQRALEGPQGQVLETDTGYYRSAGTGAQPIVANGAQLQPRTKPLPVKPVTVEKVNKFTGLRERWEQRPGEPDKQVSVETPGGLWVSPGTQLTADAISKERESVHARQTRQDNEKAAETERQRLAAEQNAAEAERAANDHLDKRRQAEEQGSRLQGMLTALGAVSPDDPRRIELESQIKAAREESTYRQREADTAFADARKAKAEAKRYATSPQLSPRKGRKGRPNPTYFVDKGQYDLP